MEYYKAPDWVFKAIENQKSNILKEWSAKKLYKSDYYKQIFTNHMGEAIEEMQSSGVISDPK